MAFKFLKQRWHKISAAAVLIIVVLVLILAFLANRYWSPILAQRVKSVVLTSSDSLYNVNFSRAELHILRGEIIIYNITLKPDTAVYNRRKRQHLAPNNLVELHVKRIILYHIHPFTLYFKHKLDINEIILTAPELNVSYSLNHTKDTVVKDHRTAWQKISKTLHSVHIGQIYLNDVKLKYSDYSGHKAEISELKEMNLSANDLLIDSATQTDRSRQLYCKEIVAELNNYTGQSPKGLYSFKVNHLKLSTLTSQLNAEGLTVAPVNAAEFFSKSNKDKYTFQLDSLQINHFDYLNYHKYRTVSASAIILKNGTMALYSNPHGVSTPLAAKINSFPGIALRNLTTDLSIDSILLHRITVLYSEYNQKSNQTGTITFNGTSGRIINVTNNPAALAKNHIATVQLITDFMNRGRLKVAFNFDITAKDAAFNYKGSLGYMDLDVINAATVPLTMIKITSGSLKQFNFDIHANSHKASGKLVLLYNDLKIKLLKTDIMLGLKQKLIESLYANIFIIKHNNPDNAGEPPRSFNIHYTRPDTATFFSSVWQTLLSGIKPSAGLDEKTVKATEAQLSEHQINKQKRLQKRALRKQRRAEKKRENKMAEQKK